ncbi:MAG: phosphate ABC transporter substrate-binding protein, partial [Anaerolineae bacterium]|nr:phosphate ABC transporter substrate-binding protein [Anaerolineae bacterium]
IFAGVITNWKEVGGADRPIVVVSREEGSGTRAAFQEMVMGGEEPPIVYTAILQPSSGAVRTTVASTPDSIGYVSFGYLDNSVKAVAINGVQPTAENALNGTYPVVRPFNLVTKGEPTGLVKFFINFILSSDGQRVVADEGYLPVK